MNQSIISAIRNELPSAFLSRLSGWCRYGNLFNVREEGEAQATLQALSRLEDCLTRENGCAVVPGVDEDRMNLSLGLAGTGGFLFGGAVAAVRAFMSSFLLVEVRICITGSA